MGKDWEKKKDKEGGDGGMELNAPSTLRAPKLGGQVLLHRYKQPVRVKPRESGYRELNYMHILIQIHMRRRIAPAHINTCTHSTLPASAHCSHAAEPTEATASLRSVSTVL